MSKRIIGLVICLIFIASFAGAKSLTDVINDENLASKLSSGVTGVYFVFPDTEGDYIMGSIHNQGTRAYGTGSFTSAMYYQEGVDNVTSLITASSDNATFDSNGPGTTGTGTDWAVVGD